MCDKFMYACFLSYVCLVAFIIIDSGEASNGNLKNNRPRRYLNFRNMTHFFLRFNFKANIVRWNQIFAQALGFRMNWDAQQNTIHPYQNHYIYRRTVYSHAETLLDKNGLNGFQCVRRAICEVETRPRPRKIYHKLLKMVFRQQSSETNKWHNKTKEDCQQSAMLCPFSLLDFYAGIGFPSTAKNINVNYAFQANFQLPWNRTQIPIDILTVNSGYTGSSRMERDVAIEEATNYNDEAKLYHFYKHIEDILNRFWFNTMIFHEKLHSLIILISFPYITTIENETVSKPSHRVRRQLLYPNSTLLQFNAGIGFPSTAKNINVNYAFQANFQLPWNRTQIPIDILTVNSGYTGSSRMERDVAIEEATNYNDEAKLYHFYKHIEDILNSNGHNGKVCVLHTLCQLGAEPLYTDDEEDLLHEIASFVLNPTYDAQEDMTVKDAAHPYVSAYTDGQKHRNCDKLYKGCSFSFVDVFTKLHNFS